MNDASYGVIWVCQCCVLTHANGECCSNEQHGGDGAEPLNRIEAPYRITMGMMEDEHDSACVDFSACGCAENSYSTSQCEGCGSYLHGERHAMTLWGPAPEETTEYTLGEYVYVYTDGALMGAGQITGGCLPHIPYQVRMAGTADYVQKSAKDLERHPQQTWGAVESPTADS